MTTISTVALKAMLNDPYDGVIRLLNDVQRFGYDLTGLHLYFNGSKPILELRVTAPEDLDVDLLVARIARSYAVGKVLKVRAIC